MDKIKAWFKHSETIFWARFKFAAGSLLQILCQTDATPIFALLHIDAKWVPVWQIISAWLMADGLLSEWARRRNSDL